MLPFLGDPFANSKKNYEDEDVASIQLRGIEVVGRTVSGKLLWNEADGGKAVIQGDTLAASLLYPAGASTCN